MPACYYPEQASWGALGQQGTLPSERPTEGCLQAGLLYHFIPGIQIVGKGTQTGGMARKPVGVTWVNFCWVCATGLSEPLPHIVYSVANYYRPRHF